MQPSKFVLSYRTKEGLIKNRYKDMHRRVNGKLNGSGKCLWLGLEICGKQEFYEATLINPDFLARFSEWEADNWHNRSAPAAHRIDRSRGYTLDNIAWVSHGEKSRLHLAQGRETRKAKNGG